MLITRYGKKNKKWLVIHHSLGYAAALLGAYRAPILEKLMFTWKARAKRLRITHKVVGRLTILHMGLTIISGLFQAGILRL